MLQLVPQRQRCAGGHRVVADHLREIAHRIRKLIFPVQRELPREHVERVVDKMGIDLQEQRLELRVLVGRLFPDILLHQRVHPLENPVELLPDNPDLVQPFNRKRAVEIVGRNALHIVAVPAQPGDHGAEQRVKKREE